MKITLLKAVNFGGKAHQIGDKLEVPKDFGLRCIRKGRAKKSYNKKKK